jgi:hypothetical protein
MAAILLIHLIVPPLSTFYAGRVAIFCMEMSAMSRGQPSHIGWVTDQADTPMPSFCRADNGTEGLSRSYLQDRNAQGRS